MNNLKNLRVATLYEILSFLQLQFFVRYLKIPQFPRFPLFDISSDRWMLEPVVGMEQVQHHMWRRGIPDEGSSVQQSSTSVRRKELRWRSHRSPNLHRQAMRWVLGSPSLERRLAH